MLLPVLFTFIACTNHSGELPLEPSHGWTAEEDTGEGWYSNDSDTAEDVDTAMDDIDTAEPVDSGFDVEWVVDHPEVTVGNFALPTLTMGTADADVTYAVGTMTIIVEVMVEPWITAMEDDRLGVSRNGRTIGVYGMADTWCGSASDGTWCAAEYVIASDGFTFTAEMDISSYVFTLAFFQDAEMTDAVEDLQDAVTDQMKVIAITEWTSSLGEVSETLVEERFLLIPL